MSGIRNQIAIVGLGSTGFSRSGTKSPRTLVAEAAIAAIRDAGLEAEDITGIISSSGNGQMILPPTAAELTAMLRLPNITYVNEGNSVFLSPVIDAMNAIYSGACETLLLFHANYRTPFMSKGAAMDPFRQAIRGYDDLPPENLNHAAAYAAWCGRYMYENGISREDIGYIAVNSRTNAVNNPLAGINTPITLDDYLAARMVRDPLCMLDMDLPVDGAEAFILTTAERAADMPHPSVLIDSAAQGFVGTAYYEVQLPSLARHGQDVVAEQLWKKSARSLKDVDLVYVYDGFSFIAISWLEKLGWCKLGEAPAFLREHWSTEENRLLINGRVVLNSNGGMLSEGGSQGAGFVREAVHQLRGTAGDRQIGQPITALLGNGGFFFNSQGAILVRGDSV